MIQAIQSAITEVSEDALPTAHLKRVYRYWDGKRDGADFPSIDAIDPVDIPPASIPLVGVMEVERDPVRFRIRISGTGITNATGVEFTGMYVDDVPGTEDARSRFEWTAVNGLPYYFEGPITWSPKDFKQYAVLALPFGNLPVVERIMLAFDFSRQAIMLER